MKKRSALTIIEQAIIKVPAFKNVLQKLDQQVNLHSLRHSYATHLLEEGVNIVTLKELLGHAEITTTMIYLHVAQLPLVKPHSPFDSLYKPLKNG